ncbi:hypothetical protein J3R83DRAFT_7662 [Lanmaoa asiatica]|nr:hypothetical protein J3R83DRAFT_7662 [Lanmaoa asiatica]
MSDLHALSRSIQYQGTSVEIRRDPSSGKLPCPCGDPKHARFSFQKIYALCRKNDHPNDPNAFPDIEIASTNTLCSISKPVDLSPIHSEPVEVDEPFISDVLLHTSQVHMPRSECTHLSTMGVDTPTVQCPASPNLATSPLPYVDMEVDLTPCTAPMDLSRPPPDPSTSEKLLSLGLCVDPRFRLTICLLCSSPIDYRYAHAHLLDSHKLPAEFRPSFPPKDELQKMLVDLNAHRIESVFPGPISPIPGLTIVDAIKCTVPQCQSLVVFSGQRRFNEHCKRDHPDIPSVQRTSSPVKAHFLGRFRAVRQMVEVNDVLMPTPEPLVNDVEKYLSSVQLYALSDVFQPSTNERAKGTIFAQIGWDQLLIGVGIRDLRKTVVFPNATDVVYHRLTQAVERYYASMSPLISSLPTLTARAILSTGELGSQLFKTLQEKDTLKKYSRFMALFLVFLLRHIADPIPAFPVPFHPIHIQQLSLLRTQVDVGELSSIEEQIHSTNIALMTHLSDEAILSDRRDLLTLFLVAYHLKDDAGNTTRVSAVPPNISAVQWCLRATAAGEVVKKATLYGGDTFKAYEEHVKHLITDARPSLFTYLRQKQAFLSTLAYSEPGLPQFIWDSTMTVLSVDGFPLSIERLRNSVNSAKSEMEALINKLTLSCDFTDAMAYIDSRTDPADPTMWFIDHPREDLQGTSIVSQDPKGLLLFSRQLLDRMTLDGTYFIKSQGTLVACKREHTVVAHMMYADPFIAEIWRWLADLDELVSTMYYAITLTWGGGARGTECDHLKHTVHGPGERHVFILNGRLAIVTTYVKTQHVQGHGRLIVRTPAHSISRLVIFIISVLYPLAAKLSSFVMDISLARSYLSYLFVHHGKVLNSKTFSTILQHHTEKYLGLPLGLRDYRQVMCSMLCCLAGTDYGVADEDDHDLAAIHSQFGHSAVIADAHYGIQGTNALTTISHTSVRSMQRVSTRWHACLGCSHPHLLENVNESKDQDKSLQLLSSLKAPLSSCVQQAARESIQGFYTTILPHWTSILQGFGSDLTSHLDAAFIGSFNSISSQPSSLIVHPLLSSRIKALFPGQERFSFTSHHQAELVQSCLTADHVLAVMPTGSGKSLAFFAAPILNPSSLFVVVTPFVALTEDMDRRLAALPIVGGKWSSDINPFEAQLVIVPAHEAATEGFFQWAEANSSRLQRLFVDEAHHVFTSDCYRPCFKLFHRLTQLKKPITLLTATMPVHSIPALCQSMMIDPALLRLIRAPVSRSNIKHTVFRVDPQQILHKTIDIFNSLHLAENERGIIYTTSIAFTQQIAQLLQIPAYTSRILPDEHSNKAEKSSRFQAWRSGAVQWVAATICFAEGVDFPSVRYTIIVEPKEMLSFLQESGRLGRDGLPSHAITLWSLLPSPVPVNDPDHCGRRPMVHFLQTNSCRRLAFKHFDPDVHSCASSANNVMCDQCEKLSNSTELFVPQPLRFDLPVVMQPTVPVQAPSRHEPVAPPLSNSVQANADLIRNAYDKGKEKIEQLRMLIRRVTAINCADCWVLGESHIGPHTHTRPYLFDSLISSLRAKRRDDNVFWPSCYLCWIPFRAPCFHPSISRGDKLFPEGCPNAEIPYLLPTLVSLIYLYDDVLDSSKSFLAPLSLRLSLQPPISSHNPLSQFLDWITQPADSPDTVPNFALFLNSFSECFHR